MDNGKNIFPPRAEQQLQLLESFERSAGTYRIGELIEGLSDVEERVLSDVAACLHDMASAGKTQAYVSYFLKTDPELLVNVKEKAGTIEISAGTAEPFTSDKQREHYLAHIREAIVDAAERAGYKRTDFSSSNMRLGTDAFEWATYDEGEKLREIAMNPEFARAVEAGVPLDDVLA